jgi:PilZ domain
MRDPKRQPNSQDSGVAQGQDRRASERYPCSLRSDCHPLAGERTDSWRAQVQNIATGGIGLMLKRRFEPRTVLVIGLENPEQGFARTMLARVVHAAAQGDGTWYVGCAFLRELGEDDLRACGAEGIRPAGPDCRAWVRVSCDIDSFCREHGEGTSDRWPVKVVNVSPAGLALVVSRPVPKGALLTVELPTAEGQAAREVSVRVVEAQARPEEEWLLGCEFVEQLGEDELRRLPG